MQAQMCLWAIPVCSGVLAFAIVSLGTSRAVRRKSSSLYIFTRSRCYLPEEDSAWKEAVQCLTGTDHAARCKELEYIARPMLLTPKDNRTGPEDMVPLVPMFLLGPPLPGDPKRMGILRVAWDRVRLNRGRT